MSFTGIPGNFAYTSAKNTLACSQISCTPNGLLSMLELGNNSTRLGSGWLCKSENGHVYLVSASHIVDKDDAYFNDLNIVSSNTGTESFISLFSCLDQETLYILSTSNNCQVLPIFLIKYIDPDTQLEKLGIITLKELYSTNYINLNSEKDLSDKKNNINNYLFGNNDSSTNTAFELNPDDGIITSGNNNDDNTYSLMSVNLNPIVNINSVDVQITIMASLSLYGDNNKKLYFMTEGKKLERWSNHLLDNVAHHINDIMENGITLKNVGLLNILNEGLISGNFNIEGKNFLIPMSTIGGDHRSDIVIMRPNFNMIDLLNNVTQIPTKITEEMWDSLSTIKIEEIYNVLNGEATCNIGNPYYLNKSSVNGGFIRDKSYNDTSYIPMGAMLTNCINHGGVSGGPELSTRGNLVGMATCGFLDPSGSETNISAGPNCDLIKKIFDDVTNNYEINYKSDSILIPHSIFKKNYFGGDYYALDLSYVTQILGSFFDPNMELTGFVLDNVNDDGLFNKLGLNVGDVILNAIYKEVNNDTEMQVNFGTKDTEASLAKIIYNKQINTIKFTYIKGSENFLLISNPIVITDEYTMTDEDKLYPNYADYYFGDTTTSYTKTSISNNSNVGNLNYFFEKLSMKDIFIKKMVTSKNPKKLNNVVDVMKNKNIITNNLMKKIPAVKPIVTSLSTLNIKDWKSAKNNINNILKTLKKNIK